MPTLEIKEGRLFHCGQMIRILRVEHQKAFAAVGLSAHRELRNTMAMSSYCRAGFLDGELAGLWGCVGTVLSPYSFVWLCLSQKAISHPVLILKEARRQLDEIMQTKIEIMTTVLADDIAALRLCAFLGFHCGHEGPGAPAQTKWGRKTLIDFVRANPDLRQPAGNSYAVPMGFHAQQAEMH